MRIGIILSKLIGERKVKKTELAKFLNVARNTLDDYLSENTYMTTDTLELVADFFKVPVSYFFDENSDKIVQSGKNNQVGKVNVINEDAAQRIEFLERLLEEKERILEEKERTIKILMSEKKRNKK
jgi:hypothetical protein